MKQVLLSLTTIALVCLMMVGGAFAQFSDTETSRANIVAAGTLDLVVNAENPLESTLIDFQNMYPGEYREVEINLTNQGSLAGNTWMMFTDLVCSTGAYVEPEAAVEGDTPIDDICSQIIVSIDGVEQGTLAEIANVAIPLFLLEAAGNGNSGVTMVLGFLFVEEAGNEYQGDMCEFTMVFGLDQAT